MVPEPVELPPDNERPALLDEDEQDVKILQRYFPDLDPSDPLLGLVAQVADLADPEDGLESRVGVQDTNATPLDSAIMDWRLLSPDDPKGTLIQARVQDAAIKKMDHLISRSRGEVWASRSDFLREALWHYIRAVLEGLQVTDPTLVTLLAEAELAGRAAFHAARKKKLEASLEHTRNYLTDVLNLDDQDEAARFVNELALRLRGIRVVPWKRQWLLSLNNLAIMRVTCRWLDLQGYDLPVEFYPAAGRAIPGGPTITAPPAPGRHQHPDGVCPDGGVCHQAPGQDPGDSDTR